MLEARLTREGRALLFSMPALPFKLNVDRPHRSSWQRDKDANWPG